MNIYAQQMKEYVTVRDICEMYGIEVNRAGFAICPLHHEKTASLRVFKDGVKCFGCGFYASNCIDFVMALFNLPFVAACEKINNDFCLGLPFDRVPSLKEYRTAQENMKAVLQKRKAEQTEREQLQMNYCEALDEWCRLDKQRIDNFPQGEPNNLYIEAIRKLPVAGYRLNMAEMELYEYEHRRTENH